MLQKLGEWPAAGNLAKILAGNRARSSQRRNWRNCRRDFALSTFTLVNTGAFAGLFREEPMPHPNVTGRKPEAEQGQPDKRALTVEEFIAAYGIGRTTTYEEIAAGRLMAVKLGRRTIIPREAADAWLASLPPIKSKAA